MDISSEVVKPLVESPRKQTVQQRDALLLLPFWNLFVPKGFYKLLLLLLLLLRVVKLFLVLPTLHPHDFPAKTLHFPPSQLNSLLRRKAIEQGHPWATTFWFRVNPSEPHQLDSSGYNSFFQHHIYIYIYTTFRSTKQFFIGFHVKEILEPLIKAQTHMWPLPMAGENSVSIKDGQCQPSMLDYTKLECICENWVRLKQAGALLCFLDIGNCITTNGFAQFTYGVRYEATLPAGVDFVGCWGLGSETPFNHGEQPDSIAVFDEFFTTGTRWTPLFDGKALLNPHQWVKQNALPAQLCCIKVPWKRGKPSNF